MKKITISLMAAMALLVVGCKPQNTPDPTWPRPTWQVSSQADESHSMTIIFALPDNMALQAGTDDLVGVFSGDQCLSVHLLTDTPLGYRAMMLVCGPTPNMSRQLTVSYYCTATQRLYVADETVTYVADTRLGSVDEPYVFNWNYARK